jgi:glutathione S-transferase
MIVLYQFPAAFGVPNPSPYCLKLETFLRLAGLDYQVRSVGNPRRAPKGKLPYIELDGEAIADSAIIQRRLAERFPLNLDAHLDAADRGRALVITRLCDEHLALLLLYFRWLDGEGWRQVRSSFFGGLPAPLRLLLPPLVQRRMRQALWAQGLGRHSPDELLSFAREDLQALADLLGAAAYGILANLLLCLLDTPLNRLAREFPPLLAYCERLRARVWA